MTSNQHGPLTPWATHVIQWPVQWVAKPQGGANPKNRSQFGLMSATRHHEAGITSNRESARPGEYVLGSCTHNKSARQFVILRS